MFRPQALRDEDAHACRDRHATNCRSLLWSLVAWRSRWRYCFVSRFARCLGRLRQCDLLHCKVAVEAVTAMAMVKLVGEAMAVAVAVVVAMAMVVATAMAMATAMSMAKAMAMAMAMAVAIAMAMVMADVMQAARRDVYVNVNVGYQHCVNIYPVSISSEHTDIEARCHTATATRADLAASLTGCDSSRS